MEHLHSLWCGRHGRWVGEPLEPPLRTEAFRMLRRQDRPLATCHIVYSQVVIDMDAPPPAPISAQHEIHPYAKQRSEHDVSVSVSTWYSQPLKWGRLRGRSRFGLFSLGNSGGHCTGITTEMETERKVEDWLILSGWWEKGQRLDYSTRMMRRKVKN